MGRTTLMAVAVVCIATSTARAETSEGREFTVRWYNAFGVSLQAIAAAQQTASEILQSAGFQPRWRSCRAARGPFRSMADRCDDPLRAFELLVRVVATPRTSKGAHVSLDALGDALVDVRAGAGTLATIFADRVTTAATVAGLSPGALMGRAVAHEIGHLLMGSTAHTDGGLMRPRWSVVWLKFRSARARFSQADIARMQQGLLRRAADPGSEAAESSGRVNVDLGAAAHE